MSTNRSPPCHATAHQLALWNQIASRTKSQRQRDHHLAELTHVKAAPICMHVSSWPETAQGRPWNGSESKSVLTTVLARTYRIMRSAHERSLGQARGLLDGLPGGGLNIAHEAVDRHVKAGRGDKLALRWIGRDGSIVISPTQRLARL